MQITKELLLERREKLVADANAIGGAIQDVDYWLEVLVSEESVDE